MSDIIPTPEQAKVIGRMETTNGQQNTSVKTAVSTTEEGLLAVELKPLLDYYYNTLHMQITHSLVEPTIAFKSGLVLLNGTTLVKADFPRWSKLVEYKLAKEIDTTTIQTIDITNLWLRTKTSGVGTIEAESVPNITGSFRTHGLGQMNYTYSEGAIAHQKNDIYGSSTQDNIYGGSPKFSFDASKSHGAYGRRNEVAPTSLLVYSYAFIGEYRGEAVANKTYYGIDASGKFLGTTFTLPNAIGFNSLYMVDTPPPITQRYNFLHDEETVNEDWYFVNGRWMKK